jgi:hypothetical protein
MEKLFRNILNCFSVIIIGVLLYSCGDDVAGSNSSNNTVSGTVTFIDSGFYFSSAYYYAVCIYADSTNPFYHKPVSIDSVQVNLQNKTAYFKITGVAAGHYYVASTYVKHSTGSVVAVLGSYGCDTNPNCPNLKIVTVPNSAGNGACNFLSKTHN